MSFIVVCCVAFIDVAPIGHPATYLRDVAIGIWPAPHLPGHGMAVEMLSRPGFTIANCTILYQTALDQSLETFTSCGRTGACGETAGSAKEDLLPQ